MERNELIIDEFAGIEIPTELFEKAHKERVASIKGKSCSPKQYGMSKGITKKKRKVRIKNK